MKRGELTHSQMLKDIRKTLNISQKKLAEKLGISRGYVSELENEGRNPSFELRVKIRTLHLKHCLFCKPRPFVEVLIPEQPKKTLFQRIMEWFRK